MNRKETGKTEWSGVKISKMPKIFCRKTCENTNSNIRACCKSAGKTGNSVDGRSVL